MLDHIKAVLSLSFPRLRQSPLHEPQTSTDDALALRLRGMCECDKVLLLRRHERGGFPVAMLVKHVAAGAVPVRNGAHRRASSAACRSRPRFRRPPLRIHVQQRISEEALDALQPRDVAVGLVFTGCVAANAESPIEELPPNVVVPDEMDVRNEDIF